MSRADNCATCGQKIRNGICAACLDEWAAYKAEMDAEYWDGVEE